MAAEPPVEAEEGEEALPRAATLVLGRSKAASERVAARFESPLHDEWVASWLGIALGVAFTVCFLTGLLDYLAQHPPSWFHLPARPVNLYRVTEGTHVVTGIATIPLLLAKLWSVWPKLFAWPPLHDVAQALERLSLIPLVGGSLFLLFTGVADIDYWYSPMPFFFPTAHFWTAWMVVGALIVHIGAKAATVRTALARGAADSPPAAAAAGTAPRVGLSRRGFLGAVFAAAGVLVLTVAGETVAPLRKLALLAPRNPTVGPAHVPVNQTAVQAGVTRAAVHPGYRLAVEGNCASPRSFTLDELRALPQREAGLPITCVEGWSAAASWRGVPLRLLLDRVAAPQGVAVRVVSLESAERLYSSSVVDGAHVADPDTLLALELNGEPLDLDHGYPVRLIAPDRPGVLQTKWVAKVVVL
ncbi:MAG TPA: molybdopterin-dependent oxidoreductase [Acidimicrobiales bacterium]|nr:molybdopterin-dependent oxidoreductase [Acidimicrobiales bacterium]